MSILCKICTPYIRVNFNIIVCISTIDLSCTQGQVLQLQFSSGHHSVVCAQLKNKNGGHGVSHLYGVAFMSKLVNVNASDFEPMPMISIYDSNAFGCSSIAVSGPEPVSAVQCPDKSECPWGNTCCKTSSGKYACCQEYEVHATLQQRDFIVHACCTMHPISY